MKIKTKTNIYLLYNIFVCSEIAKQKTATYIVGH